MIKLEVTEDFSLINRFEELKNLKRANLSKNAKGYLFVGDMFECDQELASYLANEDEHKNPANRKFVKVIEIKPEKKEAEIIEEEIIEKPKRKTRSRRIAND